MKIYLQYCIVKTISFIFQGGRGVKKGHSNNFVYSMY
jgi:hypothetical protein